MKLALRPESGSKASLKTFDRMRLVRSKTLLGWISTSVGPGKRGMQWFPAPEKHARLSSLRQHKMRQHKNGTPAGALMMGLSPFAKHPV